MILAAALIIFSCSFYSLSIQTNQLFYFNRPPERALIGKVKMIMTLSSDKIKSSELYQIENFSESGSISFDSSFIQLNNGAWLQSSVNKYDSSNNLEENIVTNLSGNLPHQVRSVYKNRVLDKIIFDGKTGYHSSLSYDTKGKLVQCVTIYDLKGSLEVEKEKNFYTISGRKNRMIESRENAIIIYTYNLFGKVETAAAANWLGLITQSESLIYRANNTLIEVDYFNWHHSLVGKQTYKYDKKGNYLGGEFYNSLDHTRISDSIFYEFDSTGNWVHRTIFENARINENTTRIVDYY